MSYLPINEQNQQAPQGQTTNAPQGTGTPPPQQSGGSVGGGTTGGSAKGSVTGSPSQFGSSASKLGDYLSANAPQITQQANQVATGLNNQYDTLNQGITNAANQFGQQVSQGYAAPNQAVVNQAMQNPTQFAQDPNNVSAFQAQYNDQYTGPQNFESTTPYSQIQGQVQNAVQQGGLLQTQAGLQSYLGGQQQNPTAASSTLDALLLRGNPQAQQQIQQAAGQFNNLTGQLQNAVQTGDAGVTAAQQTAQQAAQQAQNTFNPYVQNFNTGIQTAAQQAEAQRQAYNTSLAANQSAANTGRTNLLNTKQTDQSDLQNYLALHGGPTVMQDPYAQSLLGVYNADTSGYDSVLGQQMNNNLATVNNTASADQYNQAAALAKLLGTGYTSPLDQTLISQAGTYPGQSTLLPLNDIDRAAQGQISKMNDVTTLGTHGIQGAGQVMPVENPNENYAQRAADLLDEEKKGIIPMQDQAFNDALSRIVANSYGS